MAEDKKILLEVRGMKWNEHCRYTDEVLSEINKTEETELKKDRIAAEWIFKNILIYGPCHTQAESCHQCHDCSGQTQCEKHIARHSLMDSSGTDLKYFP